MRIAVFSTCIGVWALGLAPLAGLQAASDGTPASGDPPSAPVESKAAAAELAKLRGTWQLLSAETEGKPMPEEQAKKIRVTIEGNHHTVTFDDKVVAEKVQFAVDPTTTPKSIEDTLVQEPYRGKKIRGIYRLEGDILTSCVGAIDAPRPTEFTSKPGSGQTLRRFVRVKETAIAPDGASDKEYQAFEGTWRFDSIQFDGHDLPAEAFKTYRLICKGRDFTSITGEGTDRGTFSVDVAKSPKTIDVSFTEGPSKGQTWRGIYVLKDDTYKVCMSIAGADRPEAFESKPESGRIVEVLKREKP